MAYLKIAPSPELQPVIETIWVQEAASTEPVSDARPSRILPTAAVAIVHHYGDPFADVTCGDSLTLPLSYVAGQPTTWRDQHATGTTGIIVVRLRPWSASALLHESIDAFTDQQIGLADVLGQRATRLLDDQLRAAASTARRLQIIEAFWRGRLRTSTAPGQQRASAASDRMLRSHGAVRVQQLAADLGISARQIERDFRTFIGLTPRQLLSTLRFQQAARLLGDGLPSSQAALASGYYDQAHLTNTFRQLAGVTPGEFVTRRTTRELARYFNADTDAHHSPERVAALGAVYL